MIRARFPGSAAAIALVLLTVGGAATPVHAASVTLAWDPSPDASVAGYRVYVGTTSGQYTQTFDVGNVTSFSYNAAEGKRYYFAVAAYASGPLIGPLSSEVWAAVGVTGILPDQGSPSQGESPAPVDGQPTTSTGGESPAGYWSWVWDLNAAAPTASGAAPCPGPLVPGCVPVETIAEGTEPVTSLAVADDGRLFYVEGGRRIRLATASGMATEPVLTESRPTVVLNEVALDPAFAANGFIWVSETESRRDGARLFRVVRYRVAGNLAVERTERIPAMALPRSGRALFTIDASGSIYVALPAYRLGFAGAPGRIVRIGADTRDTRLIAHGYAVPLAISVDSSAGRLWVSGSDGRLNRGTTSMTLDDSSAGGPITLAGARAALSTVHLLDGKYLFAATQEGRLERTRLAGADTGSAGQSVRLGMSGQVRTIALGRNGDVYAVVQRNGSPGQSAFSIVRIPVVS